MKNRALKAIWAFSCFSILLFAAMGCVRPTAALPVPTPGQAEVARLPTPAPTPIASYIVEPGDNFWDLSRNVYDDPFLWPHIYRANRSFVLNPERIEVHDSL